MPKKNSIIPDLDKYLPNIERRYVNYEVGARLYSLPYYAFVRLAKEAGANMKIGKKAIVDLDVFEKYIETLRGEENGVSKKKD